MRNNSNVQHEKGFQDFIPRGGQVGAQRKVAQNAQRVFNLGPER